MSTFASQAMTEHLAHIIVSLYLTRHRIRQIIWEIIKRGHEDYNRLNKALISHEYQQRQLEQEYHDMTGRYFGLMTEAELDAALAFPAAHSSVLSEPRVGGYRELPAVHRHVDHMLLPMASDKKQEVEDRDVGMDVWWEYGDWKRAE